MIISMDYKTFFKIRHNLIQSNEDIDTGYYLEDDNSFTLLMYVKEYFAKTVILKSEIVNLSNINTPEPEILGLSHLKFNETIKENDFENFKKEYLNGFLKVLSFEQ